MNKHLDINSFLLSSRQYLILDTRSEKEFDKGHIPGAFNIPLLDNESRHLVGIKYKTEGREAAVELGFELTGPKFSPFIRKVKELLSSGRYKDDRSVFVYCWRGGMRSGIMSWILAMAGFKVTKLDKGYKSFRQEILSKFSLSRKIAVLGGKTGSGKTMYLHLLEKSGYQILDLENLASHRGSAFGNIGLPSQPPQEHFENLIGYALFNTDPDKLLLIENESRMIGKVKIPDPLYALIRSSKVIELVVSKEHRVKRIIEEYGPMDLSMLIESTRKLEKRLGNLSMKQAVESLQDGDKSVWAGILLDYYDKMYQYGMDLREDEKTMKIPMEENGFELAIIKESLNKLD